jgi:hypothetical protein
LAFGYWLLGKQLLTSNAKPKTTNQKLLPPLLCRLTNNFLFNGKSNIRLRISYGGQVKKSKIKKSNTHLGFAAAIVTRRRQSFCHR